jgi:penicillin-binding protein-related factor A (putative recombinase)
MARKSRKTQAKGKALEKMLDFTHQLYRNQRKADIAKRQIQTAFDKKTGKMSYIRREGFDYEGCLAPFGRSVCIEAKEAKDRLYVDKKNKQGLRLHQLEALLFRYCMGAHVGVIWQVEPETVLLLDGDFLFWFKNNIYQKTKGSTGKPMTSISMGLALKNECPNVYNKGLIDYLEAISNVTVNIDSRVFTV